MRSARWINVSVPLARTIISAKRTQSPRSAVALDRRRGLARCSRAHCRGPARGRAGWPSHGRRRRRLSRGGGCHQVADHDREPPAHAVEDHIVAGDADQLALHLEPDDAALRHPRREAQHRRAGAAAEIEHRMRRLRRHGGGEEDRVDRGPRPVRRLAQPDPPAEQVVLGERAPSCGPRSSQPRFGLGDQRRGRVGGRRSATISRRWIAPMLPSTRLVCWSSTRQSIPASVKQRLQPGQPDDIVSAQQLFHRRVPQRINRE